jgi:Aerotolerance regulator N-terminal
MDLAHLHEYLGFSRAWVLWFLLLLPVVFLLYREPSIEISTDRLGLWRRALARLPRRKRRKPPLGLLLTMLMTLLIVIAAAGAGRPQREGPRRFAVVVDLSPSMQFLEKGVRRLRTQVPRLEKELADIPPYIPGRLLVLRDGLLEEMLVWEPREMGATKKRGLPTLQAPRVGGIAHLGLARRLAERSGDESAVFVYSDGAGPSPWPKLLPDNLYLRAGGSAEASNPTGFISAQVVDPWPGAELQIQVGLRQPLAAGVELQLLSKSHKAQQKIPLEGGGAEPIKIDVPRVFGSEIEVRLEPGDGFALDESLVLQPRPVWGPTLMSVPYDDSDLRVLEGYLEEELGADVLTDEMIFASKKDRLLLMEGGELARWPTDGMPRLCFGTRLPELSRTGPLEGPVEWERGDPMLRGLELSTLRVEEGLRGKLPEKARVLARVGGQPYLLLLVDQRMLWCASELGQNSLVEQAFLPLLILRCLRELAPEGKATSLTGLLDPREGEVAARPAPRSRPTPVFFRPRRPYWPELLGAFLVLLLLRFFLS